MLRAVIDKHKSGVYLEDIPMLWARLYPGAPPV
jgi:hypothetical protein